MPVPVAQVVELTMTFPYTQDLLQSAFWLLLLTVVLHEEWEWRHSGKGLEGQLAMEQIWKMDIRQYICKEEAGYNRKEGIFLSKGKCIQPNQFILGTDSNAHLSSSQWHLGIWVLSAGRGKEQKLPLSPYSHSPP